MRKTYCDICGKEIVGSDRIFDLHIECDGKPAIQSKEICPFCKCAIVDIINGDEVIKHRGSSGK